MVVSPWFLRNNSVHGAVMAPGADRLLWLKSYEETFTYPADRITREVWMAQAPSAMLSSRLVALRWNLLNAVAAQGEIFLVPFVAIGAWLNRRDRRVWVGTVGWLALLFVMTILFPFAGSRGGFFHAGAGFQALWWVLAPIGLDAVVAAARKKGLFTQQAFAIFRGAMVAIAVLMSAVIFSIRVLPGWGEGEQQYPRIDALLGAAGAEPSDVVMVRNPPGYYIMSGRWAIVVPYGGSDDMLAAARRYDARFLVLEEVGAAGPIRAVYDNIDSEVFDYLGELDGTHIYRIQD